MLNAYKRQLVHIFPDANYSPNLWMILTTIMGRTSNDIMTNNHQNMEANIVTLLFFIVKIAYVFNIDLEASWVEWREKAIRKRYHA